MINTKDQMDVVPGSHAESRSVNIFHSTKSTKGLNQFEKVINRLKSLNHQRHKQIKGSAKKSYTAQNNVEMNQQMCFKLSTVNWLIQALFSVVISLKYTKNCLKKPLNIKKKKYLKVSNINLLIYIF